MGINSGFTTLSNFGCNDRLDYTALGSEVNLASRPESNAEVDSIYVSSSTHIMIHEKYECESRGEISVKGFAEPVPVFKVIEARGSSRDDRSFGNHSFEGFSLYMDLEIMTNHKKVHEALVDAADKLKKQKSLEDAKKQGTLILIPPSLSLRPKSRNPGCKKRHICRDTQTTCATISLDACLRRHDVST